MSKLTDEQIVEALECCEQNKNDCTNCPQFADCFKNDMYFLPDAIDLINRLKAEIEQLEKGQLKEAMAFNSNTINNAVNEALTEFWNRLKSQNTLDKRIVSVASGDNLLKEMVNSE